MSRPINVRLGRTPVQFNASALIVIVFIAILACILLAGGKGDKAKVGVGDRERSSRTKDRSDGEGRSESDRGKRRSSSSDSDSSASKTSKTSKSKTPKVAESPKTPKTPKTPRTPSSAGSAATIPNAPGSAGTIANPPRGASVPNPPGGPPVPDDRDNYYDINKLKKVSSKTSVPTQSALKGGRAGIGRARTPAAERGVEFLTRGGQAVSTHLDGDPNDVLARVHSEKLMHGDRSEMDYAMRPPTVDKDAWMKGSSRRMAARWDQDIVRVLLAGRIPVELERQLQQIEDIARQDSRGRTLAGPAAQESWDVAWGSLPTLAIQAATIVSAMIQDGDIDKLKGLMDARQQLIPGKRPGDYNGIDGERSWKEFIKRTCPDGQPVDRLRVCIGWFADAYRCVTWPQRMTINDTPVKMTSELPYAAYGLKWLETLGQMFWRLKLFTVSGVDLHGLGVRLAMPATIVQGNSADPNNIKYSYQFEMTVFLWGGPPQKGLDEMGEWSIGLYNGYSAMRCVTIELSTLFNERHGTPGYADLCTQRRLRFRPGYTRTGINQSLAQSASNVNRDAAHFKSFARRPTPVIFGENVWESVSTDRRTAYNFATTIGYIHPTECCLTNLRQHQWAVNSMTPTSDLLDQQQIATIFFLIGPAVQERPKSGDQIEDTALPNFNSIRKLDFASYIPLVLRVDPSSGEKIYQFFPIKTFPAVHDIIIPYLNIDSSQPGQTARIILDANYGIRPSLLHHQVWGFDRKLLETVLRVFVTTNDARSTEALTNDLLLMVHHEAKMALERTFPGQNYSAEEVAHAKKKARATGAAMINSFLNNIFVIEQPPQGNTSNMATNIQPRPLRFPDPIPWPRDLL